MHNLVISSVAQSVFYNGNGMANLSNLPIPSGVKSLYWDDSALTGWIENLDENGNYIGNTDIAELPEWGTQCLNIYQGSLPPLPTPIEICKYTAKGLLSDTDWTEVPSVSDVTNTVYLINVADFINYRVAVRQLAVNPVANPVWPTLPIANWSK